MARRTTEEQPAVYRAVITWSYPEILPGHRFYPEGRPAVTRVEHFGPYTTKSPATATVSRLMNEAAQWHAGRTVEGHVERGTVTWEKVEN